MNHFAPGEASQICSKICQDPEKAREAFLTLEAALLTRESLYARLSQLPSDIRDQVLKELKAIVAE